jgi:hypothetical protein
MTRIRRALALLLAIALCTAAVIAWWPKPESTPAPAIVQSAPPAAPAATPVAPEPAATPPATPPPAQLTRRRASESRLADIAPVLQARADAGDASAACRLGVDLLRCRQLANYRDDFAEDMRRQERRAEEKGRLEDANSAAMMLLRYTELRRTCDGVDTALVERGGHYLRQAALAGEPDAVLRYAAGDTFGNGRDYRFIATPEFDQWRREAPQLLRQSLAAGDPGAVLLMLQSHATNAGLLASLLPPDPLEAQTSRALARRVFGEQLRPEALQLPQTSDPELVEAAEARAAELHARHFGGTRHDFRRAAHAFLPLHDLWGMSEWPLPGATLPVGQGCRPKELR